MLGLQESSQKTPHFGLNWIIDIIYRNHGKGLRSSTVSIRESPLSHLPPFDLKMGGHSHHWIMFGLAIVAQKPSGWRSRWNNQVKRDQHRPKKNLVTWWNRKTNKPQAVAMLKNMATASVKGRVGDDITQCQDDEGSVRNCSSLYMFN